MTLKITGALLALTLLLPTVAASQSTDQFNNIVPPATSYDDPTLASLYPNSGKTPLQRLQKLCSSEKRGDRQKCNQAWREINMAYAKLKSGQAVTMER